MRRIQRQSTAARTIHWIHTISCLLLFYTGIALYIPALNGMAVVFGGIQNSRLVHHWSAFAFMGIPLLAALFMWSSFTHFMKELFTWEGEDDTKWLKKFPGYMFNAKTELPPQGKIKSGQKFADWFILGSAVLISISGIIIYFDAALPIAVVQWMHPLHELSMIVLGVFLLTHIYMGAGIFQPYRGMLRAMFGDGTVSSNQAKYHWSKWAKEQKTK